MLNKYMLILQLLIKIYIKSYLQFLILSEKAGSGIAFFMKFNIDFNKAAL